MKIWNLIIIMSSIMLHSVSVSYLLIDITHRRKKKEKVPKYDYVLLTFTYLVLFFLGAYFGKIEEEVIR